MTLLQKRVVDRHVDLSKPPWNLGKHSKGLNVLFPNCLLQVTICYKLIMKNTILIYATMIIFSIYFYWLHLSSVLGCNKIYNEASGIISSPFYPYHIPKNLVCNYEIRSASGNRIFLKHKRSMNTVSYYFARVFEGVFQAGKASWNYPFYYYDHGRYQQPKYISQMNIVTIRFQTTNTAFLYNNQFYYSTVVGEYHSKAFYCANNQTIFKSFKFHSGFLLES